MMTTTTWSPASPTPVVTASTTTLSTNRSPPSSSGGGTAARKVSSAPGTGVAPLMPLAPDPVALLDALDQQYYPTSHHHHHHHPTLAGSSSSTTSSSSSSNLPVHPLITTTSSTTVTTQAPPPLDPVAFLNQHYTTEVVMMAQLPALRQAVSERIHHLDERISTALQRQSETAPATRQHVQDAKASCTALEHRIRQVQDKASQSEKAVLEITKDMKRLDCARRHLQRTITTLKRLHMLIHAVEQLRLTACQVRPFPDYPTAAHLIDAIRLLLEHFDAYTLKVESMRLLSQKVQEYQQLLHQGLVAGFRRVALGDGVVDQNHKALTTAAETGTVTGESTDSADTATTTTTTTTTSDLPMMMMTPPVLQGGVLLLDALGEAVRTRFIHEFSQDHLAEYVRLFEPPARETPKPAPAPVTPERRISSFKAVVPSAEATAQAQAAAQQKAAARQAAAAAAGLDHMEKRFTWFRQVLETVEAKFPQVFPPRWNVQAIMATMFLQLTRDHVLALLEGPRRDPDASNATILLKALHKTILFEKDITVWLKTVHGTVFEKADGTVETEKKPAPDQADGPVEPSADEKPAVVKPLIGMASSAFESYMDPYIRLEEQSMDEHLVEALEDRTVDTRGERPVFISSTNLFVYIKGSITRCTALTKGNAFFLLYRAFQDSLRKYCQILNTKLPNPVTTQGQVVVGVGGLSIPSSFAGVGGKQEHQQVFRIPKGEEITVCHVISTCEYCADTVEALEDLIRETIDLEYKTKINMTGEQEAFHDTTAKAIRVLVSGLTNRTENGIKSMSSINWGSWDAVGEESQYVRKIHEEIEPFALTVRTLLPTSYFRSFCDKYALAFSTTYYDALVRLKRINEQGTQQLLLDVYSLKTLFLKLPVIEEGTSTPGKKHVATGSTIAPAMYTKMVQKQFGRIETLLKLVGTPNELLIDNFKVQWAGGTTGDLQTVMNLKGLKRNEQAALLEKFGVDQVAAVKGVTANVTGVSIMSERVQALQDQSKDVAAKVNSDLNQMRQKVDDFRKSFVKPS